MSKRKLIVAYVFLVGVPLLGLLGILRAGQQLTPPIAVGGAWNLDADLSGLPSGPCQALVAGISQPFFSITQSGTNLVLSLNNSQKTTLSGTLQQTTLTAGAGLPQSSSSGTESCGDPQAIHLEGTVDKQTNQRILTGTLSISSCSACAPVTFHAARQNPPAKGGR